MAGWSIACSAGTDAEHRGERACKLRMPECKSARIGLVGNDTLAADQKLACKIAGDEAQEPGRQPQQHRAMQRMPERGGKLRIGDRRWRSRVDGTGEARRRDHMRDQANEVVALDPAHPLLAGADRGAEAEPEGQQHARQRAALGTEHYADAQPHHPHAKSLRAPGRTLPGLADAVAERALAAVEFSELFILPETIPANRRAADQHGWLALESRDQAH